MYHLNMTEGIKRLITLDYICHEYFGIRNIFILDKIFMQTMLIILGKNINTVNRKRSVRGLHGGWSRSKHREN